MRVVRRHLGAPIRFDAAVRALLGAGGRRLALRLIADGSARLNGRTARKGDVVRAGDEVAVPILPPLAAEPALPVRVLDERADLHVVEKPAPMPSVPLDPRERGTLANFVVARWPACRGVGDGLTNGVAHRLDTGTSGLVLVADSPESWDALRRAFATGGIRKEYLAVVCGVPPLGTVATPLGRATPNARRMVTRGARGRMWKAETEILAVEPLGRFARVRIAIRTGVTHQVRAHLASLGTPVVGDVLYGGPPHPALPDRHALHATRLTLDDARDLAPGDWRSPPPDCFDCLR